MNIALTGHTGFLGKSLASLLVRRGYHTIGISRSTDPDSLIAGYQMNVVDRDALSALFAEKQIDCLIHCAAKVIVADCAHDPFGAFVTNSIGTASVLQAAKDSGVRKTIVVETDKVYGHQDIVPTDEHATLDPTSAYELSKAIADQFCAFYGRGMDIIRVRPANLFGPGDYLYSRIVPAAMRAVAQGKPIPLHESAIGMCRDFLYVEDAAEMILRLVIEDDPEFSVYNLSRNDSTPIIALADLIAKTLDHRVPHEMVGKPGDYSEIPEQSIDGTRFVQEFDFQFTPMELAIRQTFDCYKSITH